ncbi:ferritin-like domain-containing protein [Pontixanthobacter luteolus]|uniref:ferritin-like domain-containing protein n=1 Tax=Pontixanthobacter luteolus TaxID=295089 RepID=UPI0023024EB2|nr:DUF2202 domain-containing protein [Pontixanthobacter luteolus]
MRLFKILPLAAALALSAPACSTPAESAPAATDAEALELALADEYLAEATYTAVLKKFGDVRPFSNIISAERHHADLVKAEMDRLGLEYSPGNDLIGQIEAPETLLSACETGVTAEEENIALYDRLLPGIVDPQVRETLTKLQWASRERHLPAFERCVARGGQAGQGAGQGRGFGGGPGRNN